MNPVMKSLYYLLQSINLKIVIITPRFMIKITLQMYSNSHSILQIMKYLYKNILQNIPNCLGN